MLEKGKISGYQLLILLITMVLSSAILFIPKFTAKEALSDGWIALLLTATTFGIMVVLVTVKLGLRFPSSTIIEYLPKIMGIPLGKLIGLGYIFFFIFTGAVVIREFADFITTAFMPETPSTVFIAILILVAAFAVGNGVEVIARMNEFIFPLTMISIMAIILLSIPSVDLGNLYHPFENGIKPILRASMASSGFRGEVVLLLMLLPLLNRKQEGMKTGILAVVIIGFILALVNITAIAVFGPYLTATFLFPTQELARYIDVGNFLERGEALMLLAWVTGVLVKVSVFYYVSVLGLAQWSGLKDYKSVVLPVGVIMGTWAIICFQGIKELEDFILKSLPPFAFTFEIFIPVILLMIALIRRKRAKSP
ncbi:MAG: GerAB/ArcD/ProY family transporter [Bacillota bacterium]